uniref:Uncharacterized protein n=1 Tax=Cucumis melo TaxID=3656 RepID=A0A9I9DMG8_CUCME
MSFSFARISKERTSEEKLRSEKESPHRSVGSRSRSDSGPYPEFVVPFISFRVRESAYGGLD